MTKGIAYGCFPLLIIMFIKMKKWNSLLNYMLKVTMCYIRMILQYILYLLTIFVFVLYLMINNLKLFFYNVDDVFNGVDDNILNLKNKNDNCVFISNTIIIFLVARKSGTWRNHETHLLYIHHPPIIRKNYSFFP